MAAKWSNRNGQFCHMLYMAANYHLPKGYIRGEKSKFCLSLLHTIFYKRLLSDYMLFKFNFNNLVSNYSV